MKISKGMMLAVLVLFVLAFAACGGSEYGDMKEVMNGQAKAMEKYINAMGNAGSAQDVVAAVNDFTSDMKVLIPKMKKTMAQYPEIVGKSEPPEELKAEAEAMKAASGKMQGAMMKIMEYMKDPAVQKAMEEQGKIMMEMSQK